MDHYLFHTTTVARIEKPEDLRGIFKTLSAFDNDLQGFNGPKYLWEEAKANCYDTNASLLDEMAVLNLAETMYVKPESENGKTISKDDIENAIQKALMFWMERDGGYYMEASLSISQLENEPIYALSLALTGRD